MKIRAGNKVKIIAGDHKGKKDTVYKALPKKSQVVLASVAIKQKFNKATGQNKTIRKVIHVSNVKKIEN